MKVRYLVFTLLLLSLFAARLIFQLAFLQIKKHDFYQALGAGEQGTSEVTRGDRGEIFFSNGDPLALNKTEFLVFISPKEIKEKEKTAKILSEILSLPEDNILSKCQKENYFEVIKKALSDTEIEKIEQEKLQGVYITKTTKRYYPQKDYTAYITGFVGGEGTGQYGLEGFYEEALSGKTVITKIERTAFGFLEMSPSSDKGTDLYTTIDPAIQFAAYEILAENQEKLGFKSGQVLVMEPNSGKIRALVQFPSFDPNSYSEVEDFSLFQNRIIQTLYEPGSVFKPITMAGALNEGRITPETTYVDPGVLKVGGYTIHNYADRVWGKQTMTNVLEKSINTGAVFAERQLGDRYFIKYLEKFGFFEKTGVELQGEVFSRNEEFKKGYEINFATASFGQGISVTPLQLACAFSAIANGGHKITPQLVEKSGTDNNENSSGKEIISEETSRALTNMLVSVVENGFAKKAGIDGYYVAGKTGTAQIPWTVLGVSKKGYSEETAQTFIGFAPAFDPRFLVLVKLDSPKTRTAEYSAMPMFREIAEAIINFEEIPPTR